MRDTNGDRNGGDVSSTSGLAADTTHGSTSRVGIAISTRDSLDSVAIRRASIDTLLGQTIAGRFKILTLIARGGMGRVYKAEQEALGRVCALKILSPRLDGEQEFNKRFFLEASIVSKLSHPNTIRVFDYGYSEAQDVYYIAMEYIEGRTLAQALRDDGPFAEARICSVTSQICRSLREAHGVGVVHRDLKPSNILLVDLHGEQEDVKVLDFGLVKDFTGLGEDLTETGMFMGSPKYMAPEQITGGNIGPATDVYSLGVLMYEMVTGKVPFDRGVGTLVAHVNESVPPFPIKNPNVVVSPEMDALIFRCLSKKPDDRYPSMKDLLLALKAVAGGPLSMTETQEAMPRVSLAPRTSTSSAPPAARDSVVVGSAAVESKDNNGPQSSAVFEGFSHGSAPSLPPSRVGHVGDERRRAPVSLLLLALAGAVVLLAMALVRWLPGEDASAKAALGAAPAATERVDGQAAPRPSARPNVNVRFLRVESDPSGAVVRENGRELCTSTPCQVTWMGGEAATKHSLTIEKAGFKSSALSVGDADEKVVARLEFAMVGAVDVPDKSPDAPATAAPIEPAPRVDSPTVAAPVAAVLTSLPTATAKPIATAEPAAPSGPIAFGEGMTRPTMVSGSAPVYTREALEAKIEGVIILKCTIQTSGSVSGCRIIKGLPHMNDAVLAAMAGRKYTPVMLQGKAVAVDYVFNVKLVLP